MTPACPCPCDGRRATPSGSGGWSSQRGRVVRLEFSEALCPSLHITVRSLVQGTKAIQNGGCTALCPHGQGTQQIERTAGKGEARAPTTPRPLSYSHLTSIARCKWSQYDEVAWCGGARFALARRGRIGAGWYTRATTVARQQRRSNASETSCGGNTTACSCTQTLRRSWPQRACCGGSKKAAPHRPPKSADSPWRTPRAHTHGLRAGSRVGAATRPTGPTGSAHVSALAARATQ